MVRRALLEDWLGARRSRRRRRAGEESPLVRRALLEDWLGARRSLQATTEAGEESPWYGRAPPGGLVGRPAGGPRRDLRSRSCDDGRTGAEPPRGAGVYTEVHRAMPTSGRVPATRPQARRTPFPPAASTASPPVLDVRIARLRALLAALDRAVVCFSGGVDSGYLLRGRRRASSATGRRPSTAVSPSLAPRGTGRGRGPRARESLGVRHVLVETPRARRRAVRVEPRQPLLLSARSRCTRWRWPRRPASARRTSSTGSTPTTAGTTGPAAAPHSSRGCARPSTRPASARRTSGRRHGRLGLPVWNKPALACLSSRLPYGTGITPERLARVAAAERALRELGFLVCRVRFHGASARIEVEPHEIPRLRSAGVRDEVVRRFPRRRLRPRDRRPAGLPPGLAQRAAVGSRAVLRRRLLAARRPGRAVRRGKRGRGSLLSARRVEQQIGETRPPELIGIHDIVGPGLQYSAARRLRRPPAPR